jgi:hypothetical protein
MVKVKFTLENAMKAHRGSKGIVLLFLQPRRWMGVGGRHAQTALPPGERPDTHCTGDWVGPSVGLDGCGKFRFNGDSIPGPSSP